MVRFRHKTKPIMTFNHTDAGEHLKKGVSHIGCGASYIKKKKSGLRQKENID